MDDISYLRDKIKLWPSARFFQKPAEYPASGNQAEEQGDGVFVLLVCAVGKTESPEENAKLQASQSNTLVLFLHRQSR